MNLDLPEDSRPTQVDHPNRAVGRTAAAVQLHGKEIRAGVRCACRTDCALYCFAGALHVKGRRVAHVTAEAWQGDRNDPIASLTAHFLLQDDN